MSEWKTEVFIFRGRRRWILCAICKAPASCAGEYETCDDNKQPACDACCGHGNEDGYCENLPQAHEVRLFHGICPERHVYQRESCEPGKDGRCKHCNDVIPPQPATSLS